MMTISTLVAFGANQKDMEVQSEAAEETIVGEARSISDHGGWVSLDKASAFHLEIAKTDNERFRVEVESFTERIYLSHTFGIEGLKSLIRTLVSGQSIKDQLRVEVPEWEVESNF
jgi:hypothetical protein